MYIACIARILVGLLPGAPATSQPALPLAAATFQQLEPRHLAAMEPFIPRHITRTLDDKISARHLLAGEGATGSSNSQSGSGSESGASKAEVRELTVLFASVHGVDLAAKLPLSQAVFGAVQRGIYTFGGSINKLLVDDKGTSVVALFGLPPLVHADAPARAIAAAFLLNELLGKLSTTTGAPPGDDGMLSQNTSPAAASPTKTTATAAATATRRQPFAARVGITTARTFCGVVGAAHRREFTVMGDSVNLAARLMAACGDVQLPPELYPHVPRGPLADAPPSSSSSPSSSNHSSSGSGNRSSDGGSTDHSSNSSGSSSNGSSR